MLASMPFPMLSSAGLQVAVGFLDTASIHCLEVRCPLFRCRFWTGYCWVPRSPEIRYDRRVWTSAARARRRRDPLGYPRVPLCCLHVRLPRALELALLNVLDVDLRRVTAGFLDTLGCGSESSTPTEQHRPYRVAVVLIPATLVSKSELSIH